MLCLMFLDNFCNNTITDGGVAPPTLLLTIVMISSIFNSLRISRNSKDSRRGRDRIVGCAQADSDYQILEIETAQSATTICHRLTQTAPDCHILQ